MMTSQEINELAKALVALQGDIEPAPRNATNPHLKNKYANLTSVWEAIRPSLFKHGLALVQTLVPCDEQKICIRTTLLHTSGQWIAGECRLPCPKQEPQGYGSAITYAKRYSIAAMLGVVTEEDDDGEGANRNGKGNRQLNMKEIRSLFARCVTVEQLDAESAALGVTRAHPEYNAIVAIYKEFKSMILNAQ